jgi:hypothetical protein
MNRLDTKPRDTSFTITTASDVNASLSLNTNLRTARRLIVLIPADADYSAATPRIWELANAMGRRVQLLGLCKDAAQEPGLRRELVTMSALIQDGGVCAEVQVEIGTNWIDTVKRNFRTGDMIVCSAGQHTGLFHGPLSQILQADLDAPVYVLSGLSPQNSARSNRLSQILAWTGSIGIIAGFALLQIRIISLTQDWVQTTLLILSVIVENWLIWGWNTLFG